MAKGIGVSWAGVERRRTALAAKIIGGLMVVALACLWLSAGSASALIKPNYYEELSPTEQEAVTDFIYDQSPQTSAPYSGPAEELGEDLSSSYEAEAEGQPWYKVLVGDLGSTEEVVGLMPKVADVFTVIGASTTAFAVGWKIGEGAKALFADLFLGEDSAPEPNALESGYRYCYTQSCGGQLVWREYGEEIYYGATVQQKPGAYLYAGSEYQWSSYWGYWGLIRWFGEDCFWTGFPVPQGAELQTGVATVGAECQGHPVEVEYPYVTIAGLLGTAQFHHYDPLIDGTPDAYTAAPADPGTEVVEKKAAEAIDQSEALQAFLTAAFEAETKYEYFPAQTATEKKVDDEERRCDRGTGPTFYNLDGNQGPEPFEVKEPTAFTVTDLPPGVESPSPVYLRWGETSWLGEKLEEPEFMDLWGGWGWRHVQAKHGWNTLDREETALALLTPQEPVKRGGGKWRYSGIDPQRGTGGVECERRVVVQFEKGKEADPAPLGIVTSFNVVK